MTETDHIPSPQHGRAQGFAELKQGFSDALARACALYAVTTPGQAAIFLKDLDAWPAARHSLGITQSDLVVARSLLAPSNMPLKAAQTAFPEPAMGLVLHDAPQSPILDLVTELPTTCPLCQAEEEDTDA